MLTVSMFKRKKYHFFRDYTCLLSKGEYKPKYEKVLKILTAKHKCFKDYNKLNKVMVHSKCLLMIP